MFRSLLRYVLLLLVLGIITTLLYGSYLVLREANFAVPSLGSASPGKRALISMDGFRMVQSDNGRAAWRMSAGSAELFETRKAQIRDLEIVMYYPDGRTAALIAEEGSVDTENGNASVQGGTREVRIVTSDGYLMTTDILDWNAGEREVTTPSSFRVLGKEIYLEGLGMSANADLRKVVVKKDVKAILQE